MARNEIRRNRNKLRFSRTAPLSSNVMINDHSIIVPFRQQRPCSTRLKTGTGTQYPTLAIDPMRFIKKAYHHRQFHTLPGLLDSRAALTNSNPNACMPMQGGSLYHFYDGLWYDQAGTRTHDLLHERRTR